MLSERIGNVRPISLLPDISKLFEKLLLKRLKAVMEIPDHQFGFRNQHLTIDQIHRMTAVIEKMFEDKKFCCTIFFDVSQASDRVWHEGLVSKLSWKLPGNYCRLIQSYLSNRQFQVVHDEATSNIYQVQAGVPQGSVIGPPFTSSTLRIYRYQTKLQQQHLLMTLRCWLWALNIERFQ